MNQSPSRFRLDPAATLAALVVLCSAPVIGMLVAGRASMLGAAVVAFCVELALLMRPRLGVYLVLICTVFNDIWFNAGFALLGIGDLAIFALLPVWIMRRLVSREGWQLPHRWPLLLGYVALAGASLAAGVAPGSGVRPFLRMLTYVMALFAFVDIIRDSFTIKQMFGLLALCGVGHAVYALATWPGSGRIEGLPIQSNALAALLAMSAIPAIGVMLHTRRRAVRLLLGGAIGLMLITIVLTISRGTYISFSLAMFWWLRRSRRLLIVAGLAAAGLAWFLGGQVQTADRIRARFEMRDNSVVNRIKVQENAIRAVIERPLLGLGFGQFAEIERAVDVNAEGGRGSHNFYLGLLASTGLPAALLLLLFVFAQLRPLFQRDGPFSRLPPNDRWIIEVLQALAIYQTVSLVVRSMFRQTEWFMLAFYCAMLAMALARAGYQSSGISSSPSPGGASS